jgi:hypothetical protein
MPLSKERLVVAGLDLQVFRVNAGEGPSDKPVVVLFFLHGRFGSSEDLIPAVEGLFAKWTHTQGLKEIIVVTFVSVN